MEGTVKFFNRKKGFGFISGQDGKDYFVHFTGLSQGTFIRDNDVVSFDAEEGERGLKATNVKLLKKASELGGGASQNNSDSAEEE
jgi:CspA family cold shock protein